MHVLAGRRLSLRYGELKKARSQQPIALWFKWQKQTNIENSEISFKIVYSNYKRFQCYFALIYLLSLPVVFLFAPTFFCRLLQCESTLLRSC